MLHVPYLEQKPFAAPLKVYAACPGVVSITAAKVICDLCSLICVQARATLVRY